MVELRRAIRIAVDLPARVRSLVASSDGRAVNLSQSGILFIGTGTARELQHESIHMELDLPDHESPVLVGGEIVWCQATGVAGIRFTDIAVSSRRRLANFVIRRAYDLFPLPR